MDMMTHIYLELLNEIGYLFIASMFLISFRYARSKKGRNSCLFLVFIFVFCGVTRLMLLLGNLTIGEHMAFSISHDIAMVLMNIFTWGFIITNKPKDIVNSMQDADTDTGRDV